MSESLSNSLIKYFLFEERYSKEYNNISKSVKMSDHFNYRTKTLIHSIESLDYFKSKIN